MIFYIPKQKGLSGEQLIGIICGTTAVFFIVLYIIILFNKEKIYFIENDNDIQWYKILFPPSADEIRSDYKLVQQENNNEHHDSPNDDSDLEFWL